ncbi:MAG: phosphoadenylyl-sulfate reductase [Planctomycetota bacterium]|nr:MAG: phosphoadenylyl-sulfate reductase [Planctomycetota bacterium]
MEMYMDARALGTPITEDTPTEEVIAWTLERFAHQRLVITTSFGMEGCALIDMYARHGVPLTVVYLDTMFFFEETYRLRDRMVERYPHIRFVNRGTSLTPEEQEKRYGPKLWETDPDLCCKLRKVDPMAEVMAEVDVWVTGLRRSQSRTRANLQLIEWDWRYQVLKVSPLYKWERPQIWAYVRKHDVPYNELHEKGYPTIGCTHCTQPVPGSRPDEYTRDGRWAEHEKTECGLHGYGI